MACPSLPLSGTRLTPPSPPRQLAATQWDFGSAPSNYVTEKMRNMRPPLIDGPQRGRDKANAVAMKKALTQTTIVLGGDTDYM